MMSAVKRVREREPSLSLRPRKSARALKSSSLLPAWLGDDMHIDSGQSEGDQVDGENPEETLWDQLQMISTSDPLVVPPLRFAGRMVRPLTTFDIEKITAWPTSLAAIRHQFRYNITPQYGRLLPLDVINLTSLRSTAPADRSTDFDELPKIPYIHLGFCCWMAIDVYVFLPQCPLDVCIEGNPGRLTNQVLEAWTDRIWLPAMYDGDARAPSSWRMSEQNRTSPLWNDPVVAEFPTYKIHDGEPLLGQIWMKVLQNSLAVNEFKGPFLVMHMRNGHPGKFQAPNPEAVFKNFEQSWLQEIDTRFIPLGSNNLKLSLSCDVVV